MLLPADSPERRRCLPPMATPLFGPPQRCPQASPLALRPPTAAASVAPRRASAPHSGRLRGPPVRTGPPRRSPPRPPPPPGPPHGGHLRGEGEGTKRSVSPRSRSFVLHGLSKTVACSSSARSAPASSRRAPGGPPSGARASGRPDRRGPANQATSSPPPGRGSPGRTTPPSPPRPAPAPPGSSPATCTPPASPRTSPTPGSPETGRERFS